MSLAHKAPIHSRIAPTPSGFLHIGNAFNFVLTWLHVHSHPGSTLRLRIDDTDTGRVRREYVDDIFRTIDLLGLDYDLGAQSVADYEHNYSYDTRKERYTVLLDELLQSGHTFCCTCSRKEIQERTGGNLYDGYCLEKNHTSGHLRLKTTPDTIRFDDLWMGPQEVNIHREMSYFMLQNKEGMPAFQVCSVADDLHYGINFIVRGQDLLSSTAAQLHLASWLPQAGAFHNTQWLHHPLMTDETGAKLSKSAGAIAAREALNTASKREAFFIRVSKILGMPECGSAGEMVSKIQLF